jgi:AMP deaminase
MYNSLKCCIVFLIGRFLAELTKEVFSDLEASKYQMAEYRISIYGRKKSEWDQMASWIVNNELYSENVVWLIQIPRIYNVYREMGTINSFQNLLDNIFLPLFEVTVDPASHPQLHVFLQQVVGLDLVDDESKPERRPTKHMPTPEQWTNVFNPAYAYYVYYCYANLYTLNKVSFICPQISACSSPSNSSFQISFSLNIYDVLSPIGALLVDLRFL